jgi:peptidoglycan/xylan/chitin deacetylase (PgdA/CDA1 family)
MRVVSPILKQVLYPALRSSGYFRVAGSTLPVVLTYHGVVPDSCRINDEIPDGPLPKAQSFRKQLQILKRNYNVISPEQFRAWVSGGEALPRRAVLLTCDDGLLNHRTEMLPILAEEQVSCMFFVTAASAEENPTILWYVELYLILSATQKSSVRFTYRDTSWDWPAGNSAQRRATWMEFVERLSEYDADYRTSWLQHAKAELGVADVVERYMSDPVLRTRFALMGKSELRQLAEAGMAIGAHTVSHPLLSKQSAAVAENEMRESQRILAEAVGERVWAMAYPFGYAGSASAREFDLAEKAGYECAFLNFGGPVRPKPTVFSLPRVHVTAEMRASELEAHVSGLHSMLQRCLRPASSTLGFVNP